jgi:hypothetical protein
MSLWFVAFQGSTPVGGPIVGVVMAAFGARGGLGLGAVTCAAAAILGVAAIRHQRGLEGEPAAALSAGHGHA